MDYMVDYSSWLEGRPFFVAPTGVWALIAGALSLDSVLAFSVTLADVIKSDGGVLRMLGALGFLVMWAVGFIAIGAGEALARVEPFNARTGRVFAVSRFSCDGQGCSRTDLPANLSPAFWMKDGRLVHGTVTVDGAKVGLYDDHGEPVAPVRTEA